MARAGLKPNVIFDCEVCGEHVERYVEPSKQHAGTGRFCSRTCAGVWRRGENHPRYVGREIDADGYVLVHRPDHPMSNHRGYIREHRLAAEQLVGRMLEPQEVVHHIDGNPSNNDPANLRVYPDNAAHMRDHGDYRQRDALGRFVRKSDVMVEEQRFGSGWVLYRGDSAEVLQGLPDDSVGLEVFSPPFFGMYTYTNTPRDMGNCATLETILAQYRFIAAELLRVLMPGRSCAVHLAQGVAFKATDGHSGLIDFRGGVIRVMESVGFHYYGEVCIDKDPQMKAIRTKDHGLLFKSLATDAAKMHMALADYVLQFRKPGENPEPIRAGISDKYGNSDGWITQEEWIEWAAPIWQRQRPEFPNGIRETNVLNVRVAREEKDERHLCPLQLDVIERCVKLWSNPGDLVLSPFAGIGSEGHVALKFQRRFVGVELKRSYFETACRNLEASEQQLQLA